MRGSCGSCWLSTPKVAIISFALAGCTQVEIVHRGVDETSANEMVRALEAAAIPSKKQASDGKIRTFAITVQRHDLGRAIEVLRSVRLPRRVRATTRGLMDESSWTPSADDDSTKKYEALEGDIEVLLESIQDVLEAFVEIPVPAPQRFGPPASPQRASVLLSVRATGLNTLIQRTGDLRTLVAGAIDGLTPDRVEVVFDAVSLPTSVQTPGDVRSRPMSLGKGIWFTSAFAVCGIALLFVRRRSMVPTNTVGAAKPSQQQPVRPVINPNALRNSDEA